MSESQARALSKGENFSVAPIGSDATSITVVMASAFANGARLDVSALQLSAEHKVRSNDDFIFFNQSVSVHGAVCICDDSAVNVDDTAANADAVQVSLSRLDDDVHRVIVAASLDDARHDTFRDASQLTVKLMDSDSGANVAVFEVVPEGGETAIIFGEFYRRNDEWKFRAVGQGYARGLSELAAEFGVDVERPDAERESTTVEASQVTDDVAPAASGEEEKTNHALAAPARTISVRRPVRPPKLPEWSLASSAFDDDEWDRARLFSVSGIGTGGERERRAVSALLAVMGGVREFGRELTRRCGAPAGTIDTYIEPEFDYADTKFRPDGLIRIRRGQREWTALVEAKTGDNALTVEQVERYVALAKQNKFDALITVSNQLLGGHDDLPVTIDKRKLKNLAVHHLSWDEVRSVAIQMSMYQRIEDTTQSWVLREFVRYLQHSNSKLHGFTDMGPLWVLVRDAVKNHTLHSKDKAATEVCHQFDQLVRHLGHDLSCLLGVDVVPIFPSRREDSTPRLQQLADSGALYGSLRIPGAVGPLVISLDLRLERATCSITCEASDASRGPTRVKALMKQIPDASPKITVQTILSGRQTTPGRTAELGILRDKPDTIVPESDKPVKKFLLSQSGPLGGKGGAARGSVVNATSKLVAEFYRDVVQNLRNP
ncbi:TerD family protein [Williamsia sp.]|uniref:TerD family protein n=1 Tax=Williamsia sp. TaxID=1872085 RepID=UPI001A1ED42B|nr:TerD family protein [Williamsia sp.]MBJ7290630.1 TerD family protein [Williamsia sp.]